MQSDNAQRHQSVKLMPWHSGILGKNKTFFSLVLTAGGKRKQKEVFVNASVCQRERENRTGTLRCSCHSRWASEIDFRAWQTCKSTTAVRASRNRYLRSRGQAISVPVVFFALGLEGSLIFSPLWNSEPADSHKQDISKGVHKRRTNMADGEQVFQHDFGGAQTSALASIYASLLCCTCSTTPLLI